MICVARLLARCFSGAARDQHLTARFNAEHGPALQYGPHWFDSLPLAVARVLPSRIASLMEGREGAHACPDHRWCLDRYLQDPVQNHGARAWCKARHATAPSVAGATIVYRLLHALDPQGGLRPAYLPDYVPQEATFVFAARAKLTHQTIAMVEDFARFFPPGVVPRSPREWTW